MQLEDLMPKKTNVRWTDEEWDELTQRVFKARMRHPEDSLVSLVNRVQHPNHQNLWPQDRVRSITANMALQPLIERLRKLDLERQDELQRLIPSLQAQVETLRTRPGKEEILAALTDDEITRRFGPTVLKSYSPTDLLEFFTVDELLNSKSIPELYAYLGKRQAEETALLQSQINELVKTRTAVPTITNGSAPVKRGLPVVVVVGAQAHQRTPLMNKFGARCQLHLMPKTSDPEKSQLPEFTDQCFVLDEFVPQAQKQLVVNQLSQSKIQTHRGTMTDLVDRIESYLSGKK